MKTTPLWCNYYSATIITIKIGQRFFNEIDIKCCTIWLQIYIFIGRKYEYFIFEINSTDLIEWMRKAEKKTIFHLLIISV